jgi:hypothetical protein
MKNTLEIFCGDKSEKVRVCGAGPLKKSYSYADHHKCEKHQAAFIRSIHKRQENSLRRR